MCRLSLRAFHRARPGPDPAPARTGGGEMELAFPMIQTLRKDSGWPQNMKQKKEGVQWGY